MNIDNSGNGVRERKRERDRDKMPIMLIVQETWIWGEILSKIFHQKNKQTAKLHSYSCWRYSFDLNQGSLMVITFLTKYK